MQRAYAGDRLRGRARAIGLAGALRRSDLVALRVVIRRSKADREAKETTAAIPHGDHLCPVAGFADLDAGSGVGSAVHALLRPRAPTQRHRLRHPAQRRARQGFYLLAPGTRLPGRA